MKRATHSLLFAVVASVMLPALASRHEPIEERMAIQIRGLLVPDASSASSPGSSSAASSTQPGTTAPASSLAATTTTPSSAAVTSAAPSSTGSAAATHAASDAPSSTQPVAVVSSAVPTTATNAAGEVVTSLVPETFTSSGTAPSQTNSSNNSSGGGLGTGSIIGLSLAGGIAVLGIVLFFVWKFTRKRFADFDDNEAIKWPELNTHNVDVHALPTNSTGRAGFGPENDSDVNLTRAPSPGGAYANSVAASSVPEVYGAGDPYAVPPLPHLNPNQPYRDDPGAYGQPAGYYDPYHGPVPNTFTDTLADGHGAESIPMTQMVRARSPGPQVAYDMQGRSSPAPQVAYDMQGRGSPAPQAAIGYASIDERSGTPIPGVLGAGGASPSPHLGHPYSPR